MEKRHVLSWLGGGRSRQLRATELYGAVVAAARRPWFYAVCGVPDTPEGRFEMVGLHLSLVLGRLGAAGGEAGLLARALTETFVTDMDDCMREMGVGDLTVPRKVKKAAAALADRTRRYTAAKDGSVAGFARAIEAVLPGLSDAQRLAHYAARAGGHVAALSLDDLLAGRVSFPDPEMGRVGSGHDLNGSLGGDADA